MKKKKSFTAVYILIAVVVLSLAVIFLLPSLSKEGYAIRPTVSEAPDAQLSFYKDKSFADDGSHLSYQIGVWFNNYNKHFPVSVSYYNQPNRSSSTIWDNKLFTTNVDYISTNEYSNYQGQIVSNNRGYSFYSNPYNSMVAIYNSVNINPLNRIVYVSGTLDTASNEKLRIVAMLNGTNNGTNVYSQYMSKDVYQYHGDFNKSIDLSSLFTKNLPDGTYDLYVYVISELKQHSVPFFKFYYFSSAVSDSVTFSVKNNNISILTSKNLAGLNEFVENQKEVVNNTNFK